MFQEGAFIGTANDSEVGPVVIDGPEGAVISAEAFKITVKPTNSSSRQVHPKDKWIIHRSPVVGQESSPTLAGITRMPKTASSVVFVLLVSTGPDSAR